MFWWIQQIFSRFWSWMTGERRLTSFQGVVFLESDVDPVAELARQKLVLIGSGETAKWLRFSCPCRCGEVIALNLMQSHSPHWRVEQHDDQTLTVSPSVDATQCGSHFWIRHNQINWV